MPSSACRFHLQNWLIRDSHGVVELRADVVQPIDQTVLLSVDHKVQHCVRDKGERERVVEEEKAGNQTTMTAHETRHTRMTNDF